MPHEPESDYKGRSDIPKLRCQLEEGQKREDSGYSKPVNSQLLHPESRYANIQDILNESSNNSESFNNSQMKRMSISNQYRDVLSNTKSRKRLYRNFNNLQNTLNSQV